MSRHIARFSGAFAFLFIASAFYAAEVYMLKFVFDDLLNPKADMHRPGSFLYYLEKLHLQDVLKLDPEHLFIYIPVTLVLIFFFKGVFTYFGKYWMDSVGLHTITDLREDLYSKMLRQAQDFFAQYPTGTLISRLLNDIELMKTAVSEKLTEIVSAVFTLVALIISAFIQDWKLTIVSFIAIPLVVYPLVRFSRKLRKTSRRSQEQMAHLADRMKESLTGVKIVQMFRMEKQEHERFTSANRLLLKVNLKATRVIAVTTPLMELIGAFAVAGILYYGHFQIVKGVLTLGSFSAFVATLYAMYVPVKKLSQANNIIQQAVSAAERSVELLDWETAIVDSPDAVTLPEFSQEIRFDKVDFSYEPGQTVLDELDLSIQKGQIMAIVGPSGAGKTTLVNLLPRLFDVRGGSVLIDGHDIRKVTLKSLRGQIAMVTQETVLFNDSVAANIAYGLQGATAAQIEDAARQAIAHDFIQELPGGYDTILGEGGFSISGGQRQRIAIARALLKNPPILILDEATSALDSESEYAVQQALFNLLKGRTTLVIAHRLATVLRAHRIVVMDKGRVVESGTHQELVDQGGLYAQLCAMEFRASQPLESLSGQ
ncbi:MAG: ABC transporter ATP-binding protein [Acidobacteriota bacterium]